MNFSEWRGLTPEATKRRMTDICGEAKKGDMPLWYYVPLHREARLTRRDVSTLCSWPADGTNPPLALGPRSRR